MALDNSSQVWEILLNNGTLTHEQLTDAIRWSRSHPDEEVGHILLARGIIDEQQLLEAYARRLNLHFEEGELVVRKTEVLL